MNPDFFARAVATICLLAASLTPVRAGTFAQFRTVFGDIQVELYEQDKPATVANFLRYVQGGLYEHMFVQRCDPNFVIQAGGYKVYNYGQTNAELGYVQNLGQITNEFSVGRRFSNTYGTLAMARIGGQTNSASSQWFFNLKDNLFLDGVDGGFTVFGRVVAGTNALNRFTQFSRANNNLVIADLRGLDSGLGELPLLTPNLTFSDLIFMDISLLNVQVGLAANGAREISWNSVSNVVNRVEFTTNFPPVWNSLASTNGNGATLKVTDPSKDNATRFYRVRVDY